MAVSLKDVATLAGVSIKTVSNVVNDYPYVSTLTRARVKAAIEHLGYRPNLAARNLRELLGVTTALCPGDGTTCGRPSEDRTLRPR